MEKPMTGWTQEQRDSLTAKLEMLGTLSLLKKQQALARKTGYVSPFSRKKSPEGTELKQATFIPGIPGRQEKPAKPRRLSFL